MTAVPGGQRPEHLMTPSEVASMLSVSVSWVRDHATRKEPHLAAVKLGKLLRFRRDDVQEFIRRWCQ
jgi:excisionase family DNA binding protein